MAEAFNGMARRITRQIASLPELPAWLQSMP
jgi:hypothetical protein